ncbi:MAG: OsmC family protein [Alphaproteobacteria bacterium]|nr:OsmC family protein [Alphaproteobacteria bacterium]
MDTLEPEQGHKVTVRSTGEVSPYQNELLINGRRFLADEPVSVGGAGSGPNPYEWVSAALGACTSMTLRMYADRKNWPLGQVTVRVDHAKRPAQAGEQPDPKGKVDVFSRELMIEGELDETQRARLVEIAERCPVHRTLESVAVIETAAVIE